MAGCGGALETLRHSFGHVALLHEQLDSGSGRAAARGRGRNATGVLAGVLAASGEGGSAASDAEAGGGEEEGEEATAPAGQLAIIASRRQGNSFLGAGPAPTTQAFCLQLDVDGEVVDAHSRPIQTGLHLLVKELVALYGPTNEAHNKLVTTVSVQQSALWRVWGRLRHLLQCAWVGRCAVPAGAGSAPNGYLYEPLCLDSSRA